MASETAGWPFLSSGSSSLRLYLAIGMGTSMAILPAVGWKKVMTVGVGRVFFFVREWPEKRMTSPTQINRTTVANTMKVLIEITRSSIASIRTLGTRLGELGQVVQESVVALLGNRLLMQEAEVSRHRQPNPVFHHQVAS